MTPESPPSQLGERLFLGFVVVLLVVVAAVEVVALFSIHQRLGTIGDELRATRAELAILGEQIETARGQLAEARERAQTQTSPPRSSTSRSTVAPEGLVTSQEGDRFIVDTTVLGDHADAFEDMTRQVRVIPHQAEDGSIDGFRLLAVRSGSVFDVLGFQNGDVVHRVNGHDLSSTESALRVFQALEGATSFQVEITRRRAEMELAYEIR